MSAVHTLDQKKYIKFLIPTERPIFTFIGDFSPKDSYKKVNFQQFLNYQFKFFNIFRLYLTKW